ncbi:MAG: carboxypeptidase-like regulatory domain-containing protein [Myxococcales bacterium]|nr:carboxypeptidase-like regulatory domain-containing protein [Myxococcales bacterium]
MRTLRITIAALVFAACAHPKAGHVDGGVLGRVVVYRNGVAFYERHARVENGKLTVHVPRDRVDDFLKSLTVVDPATRKPLSVTIPRKEADDGSYLTMTLETAGLAHADVLLTYVTEAPAWKPSYRVVVGGDNKVMLEGWAIVDNTTTEDWKGVLVGVGASSALAFRYDLWSVRAIDRDLLAGEEKFAIAPPTGISPYAEGAATEELANLDASEVRTGAQAGSEGDGMGVSFAGSSSVEGRYVIDGVNTTGLSTGTVGTPSVGVRGVVRDTKTGENLAGVTVVATGRNKESQAAITDDTGAYSIALPAGTYTLSFFYGEVTIERKNVTVAGERVAVVDQKLDQRASAGEVIKITDSAPMINTSSTSQGITIDRVYGNGIPRPGRTFEGTLGAAAGSSGDSSGGSAYKPPPPIKQGDDKLAAIVAKVMKDKKDVVIETHGPTGTEKDAAARGQAVKNKLVDDGVPATRIHIVPKVGPSEAAGIKVLAVAPAQRADHAGAPPTGQTRDLGGDTPVGESHFMADRPMTVRAGSSAMVAMVHGETTGGVVYLYDPISDRGDQRFAFKSVRLDNPTSDTLEPGPVTVYGDGRFIGEGITEPVPPKASVVVPFALDKQVVVSTHGNEEDRIAKLVTLQRGILTAEVQHRRHTKFTITSRLAIPAKVYLRHRLAEGWTLTEAPSRFTKVGDSQLFEVDLPAHETAYVSISEATPVTRTFELSSEDALGMMRVFIDEPEASPQLKAQITALLATHRSAADLVDKIATVRDQLGEYRSRAGELHAQLVTLKAVRTGGDLMTQLRAKLNETSDQIQKLTISLVDTQEQLLLARVKFGNQLAELRVEDTTRISGR